MSEVLPGDLLEISCPGDSQVALAEGDTFPIDNPLVIVIRTQGSKAWLGPLMPGEHSFEIPCTDNQSQLVEIKLEALPENMMPERESPIGILGMAYPSWMWIALAAIAATLILGAVLAYLKSRRRARKPAAGAAIQTASPEELFSQFLRRCEKEKLPLKEEAAAAQSLFQDGYNLLRAYLEYKLNFKASWATTSEFLGSLRTAAMSFSGLRDLAARTEAILAQADTIRFSKSHPGLEARQSFVKSLNEVYSLVQKTTRGTST